MKDKIYEFFGEEYQEILIEEWEDIEDSESVLRLQNHRERVMYFKKVEKWPKVFKGSCFQFYVEADGHIEIYMDEKRICGIGIADEWEAGYEAFKLAKEIKEQMKKPEKRYICPKCEGDLTKDDMGKKCPECGEWQYTYLAEVKE